MMPCSSAQAGPGQNAACRVQLCRERAVREKSGHISRLFWARYFGLRVRHVIFMDAPPFLI